MEDEKNYLAHYGIKGMKWGVKKAKSSSDSTSTAKKFSIEEHNGLIQNILANTGRSPRKGDMAYVHVQSENKVKVAVVKSVSEEKDGTHGRIVRTNFVPAAEFNVAADGSLTPSWRNENLKSDLKHSDLLHYGIKGMKWGVRRSKKQLAASKSGESEDTPTKKSSGPETSADRYNRLKAQASKKGPNSLSDEELRFVNTRAEAMAKVNKLNAQKPGWVQEAAKDAVKRAAQKSMQDLTTATVEKYLTDRVAAKYKLPTQTEKDKAKAATRAAEIAAKTAAEAAKKTKK